MTEPQDDRDELDLLEGEPEAEPDDELSKIMDILAGFEDHGETGAKVYIYRAVPREPGQRGRRKKAYAAVWELSEFSLEDVRLAFGGGDYSFRFVGGDGAYRKHATATIEGRPRALPADEEEPPARRAPQEDDDEILTRGAVIALMRDEFRGMLQDLRNPHPAFEDANPAAMALSIVEGVQKATGPLLEAVLSREDRGGSDPIETLIRGMELASTLQGGGGGGGGSPYPAMLDRLITPLMEAAKREQLTAGAPPADELATHPNPNPPMIDASKLPTPPPAWPTFLGPMLPDLIRWASERRDVELRVALVLEDVPVGWYDLIQSELGRPDFIDEFFAAVPAAVPHREWLTAFYGGVLERVAYDDEEEGPELDPAKEVTTEPEPPG